LTVAPRKSTLFLPFAKGSGGGHTKSYRNFISKSVNFLDTKYFLVYYYFNDDAFQIRSTAEPLFYGTHCHRQREGLIRICQPPHAVGAVSLSRPLGQRRKDPKPELA